MALSWSMRKCLADLHFKEPSWTSTSILLPESAVGNTNSAEVLREGPARSAATTAGATQNTHFNNIALAHSSTLTSPLIAMTPTPLMQFYEREKLLNKSLSVRSSSFL
ncbi:uncharacterized protein Bfra_004259 [Botrytis fragariae]|uniref:Uncharacterized protein n=1 Tax=Botrytis fragariae TaxID=1964551 RepID=A0A8H6AV66_9HELO|nr:uncharacterized protein Bfra_004259 [Botrytis fragariae]KAF5874252.1 hypothetical protein Bfra_004259 [Botrytis fragariae]